MTSKDILNYYAKHYTLSDTELNELIDAITPMTDDERLNFWRQHNFA